MTKKKTEKVDKTEKQTTGIAFDPGEPVDIGLRFIRNGDKVFVHLKYSGIHPMLILSDKLRLARFAGLAGMYVDIDIAIEWHKKEIQKKRSHFGNKALMMKLREIKKELEG